MTVNPSIFNTSNASIPVYSMVWYCDKIVTISFALIVQFKTILCSHIMLFFNTWIYGFLTGNQVVPKFYPTLQ